MKVVIGTNSLTGQLTGIGHYTRSLVEGLGRSEDIDELRLLSHGLLGKVLTPGSPSEPTLHRKQKDSPEKGSSILGKLRPVMSRSRLIVELYDIMISLTSSVSLSRYGPGDFFHSPDFQFAKFPGKTVVTIPDLSTISFPEFHPASRVAYINRHIQRAVDGADHIVAISDFVKREIQEKFGVADDRITTVYPGVDPDFAPISSANFKITAMNPRLEYKRYFIFVSTIEPRKNLGRLLESYKYYLETEGASSLPLVVVGLPGWKSEHVHEELMRLATTGHVIYLGYVSRDKLRSLLAGARALLFPSLYEGFGLPVVEAMRSGTAVLTSKNSAMSEIAGTGALLTDPLEPKDICEKVSQLHHDTLLVNSLAQKGLDLSRNFTWEICARNTISLYKSL